MPVINSIINWANFKRIYEIELFKKHPHEVQREVLFELLEEASNTEIGLKYNFRNIRSEKEFRENVPVQGYDDIKETVERMMQGEKKPDMAGRNQMVCKIVGHHPR